MKAIKTLLATKALAAAAIAMSGIAAPTLSHASPMTAQCAASATARSSPTAT